ncbi:TPA: hypothetical protein ACNV18_000039 [Pseudomonas putida]|jgi:hypothetical protein|uniref:hypothetical protein n=1 Tax=Pseudomonas TaxID=286 RepID=UPI000D971AC7|nr:MULTISPECIES: hypothetical protein [Pseudomonas]MCE0946146.1 hypothetical protein [Pseudomonas asiatica]MCE1004758.1 hypothetical protein [Pseudomonas sp. NMI1173_11]MCE1066983.1 hypothetical protein [Pseudomonas asiatica]PYD14508.1 hypothetical protein DND47_16660 [Pseudomonas syringae pv. syringae]
MRPIIETDKQLIDALVFEGEFGVSKVQRLTGWGYNQAARKLEELAKQNLIRPVEEAPYRFVLSSE